MNSPIPEATIIEIVRGVIDEIAPQERPLLRINAQAYFRNPQAALQQVSRPKEDVPLGYGAGEVVMLLTPFALAVTTEVVRFLAEEIKKTTAGEIAELVKSLFKRFRPAQPDAAVPPLTADQLAQVRARALETALQLGLPRQRATLLASAIVGSIAVSEAP